MSDTRCLVIILAETRAQHLTFDTFKQHCLEAINPGGTVDVALAVTDRESTIDNGFYDTARYVWRWHETDDFSDAFDVAAKNYGCSTAWRKVLKVKDQWLGGIKDAADEHPGSAGILIFFRWFLLQQLKESGAIDQYDWFVVTRSDHYYLAPHPPLSLLSKSGKGIWIPEGEDYGGLTDRHIVVHKGLVNEALDLMSPIMLDTDNLVAEMAAIKQTWNLESYIHFMFTKRQLLDHVGRFKRPMFAVRDDTVATRWACGAPNAKYPGMIIKYASELKMAEETYNAVTHLI